MARNDFPKGEFMEFIEGFLRAHPEVVEDQQRGWDIFWNPKVVERVRLASLRDRSGKRN